MNQSKSKIPENKLESPVIKAFYNCRNPWCSAPVVHDGMTCSLECLFVMLSLNGAD